MSLFANFYTLVKDDTLKYIKTSMQCTLEQNVELLLLSKSESSQLYD